MRSPLRARTARTLASIGLVGAILLPAASTATAADPVILRVGVTQPLDSLNPYGTALVIGYEVYGLTYDLLIGFGPNAEPAPGFSNCRAEMLTNSRTGGKPALPHSAICELA